MPLNINGRFIAVSHQYFSQCDWGHGDRALMKLAIPTACHSISCFPNIASMSAAFYAKIIYYTNRISDT